jgi:hypothetical protein
VSYITYQGRPWGLAEVTFSSPQLIRRSIGKEILEHGPEDARSIVATFSTWVQRAVFLGYDPFEIVPEPERTLQAAVIRRLAELRGWVPSALPGDLGDHYPRLRDPDLRAQFERRVMVAVMQG